MQMGKSARDTSSDDNYRMIVKILQERTSLETEIPEIKIMTKQDFCVLRKMVNADINNIITKFIVLVHKTLQEHYNCRSSEIFHLCALSCVQGL